VTRYLVCRFVLSAALIPVAVSHDLEESKPAIVPGTGDMAVARTRDSPAHSARDSLQTHGQMSTKARAPFQRTLGLQLPRYGRPLLPNADAGWPDQRVSSSRKPHHR
jgi:hypothetical protein